MIVDTTSLLQRRYAVRTRDRIYFQVSFPQEIIERLARVHHVTSQEAASMYEAVAHFGEDDIVVYTLVRK